MAGVFLALCPAGRGRGESLITVALTRVVLRVDLVQTKARLQAIARGKSDKEWLSSVVPSFLTVDYQGRVIRIDTFSKVWRAPKPTSSQAVH